MIDVKRWRGFTIQELHSIKNALATRHSVIPEAHVDRNLIAELETELFERSHSLKREE